MGHRWSKQHHHNHQQHNKIEKRQKHSPSEQRNHITASSSELLQDITSGNSLIITIRMLKMETNIPGAIVPSAELMANRENNIVVEQQSASSSSSSISSSSSQNQISDNQINNNSIKQLYNNENGRCKFNQAYFNQNNLAVMEQDSIKQFTQINLSNINNNINDLKSNNIISSDPATVTTEVNLVCDNAVNNNSTIDNQIQSIVVNKKSNNIENFKHLNIINDKMIKLKINSNNNKNNENNTVILNTRTSNNEDNCNNNIIFVAATATTTTPGVSSSANTKGGESLFHKNGNKQLSKADGKNFFFNSNLLGNM